MIYVLNPVLGARIFILLFYTFPYIYNISFGFCFGNEICCVTCIGQGTMLFLGAAILSTSIALFFFFFPTYIYVGG